MKGAEGAEQVEGRFFSASTQALPNAGVQSPSLLGSREFMGLTMALKQLPSPSTEEFTGRVRSKVVSTARGSVMEVSTPGRARSVMFTRKVTVVLVIVMGMESVALGWALAERKITRCSVP